MERAPRNLNIVTGAAEVTEVHAEDAEYPLYLRSVQDFRAFLRDQFEALDSAARGQRFADAMCQLIPHLPFAEGFTNIRLNAKQSHDAGVDILSDVRQDDRRLLCVQSKYGIGSTEEFDSVLSKFFAYERSLTDAQDPDALFSSEDPTVPVFVVATGSDLSGIIRRYEERGLSTQAYYRELKAEGRLHLVDGNAILGWMRQSFIKSTTLPATFDLHSSPGWLNAGDVYIGIVEGRQLVDLVATFGDGLFFENIRDWLGSTSDPMSVNNSILGTIVEQPARMLERNNGVTVRGERIVLDEEDPCRLRVTRAAIVNGCQTTMCLWQQRNVDPMVKVAIKAVQTPDAELAWGIAQSANYQNPVGRIELELARYLRPQVVTRAANIMGEGLRTERNDDLATVLRAYSRTGASYALVRFLFLGLFCRRPNQLFQDNYTNVQVEVIQAFYATGDVEMRLFGALFELVRSGRRALDVASQHFANEDFAKPFSRLLDAERHKYQAYLILLAACAVVRMDLSSREEAVTAEAQRLGKLLTAVAAALRDRPRDFDLAYVFAYKELAKSVIRSAEEAERTQQRLSSRVKDAPFQDLYRSILWEIKSHQALPSG